MLEVSCVRVLRTTLGFSNFMKTHRTQHPVTLTAVFYVSPSILSTIRKEEGMWGEV